MPLRDRLDIRDYLEASADASKRTRTIIIVMVIASVVVFAGLLNSIQSQWMHRRMVSLADINSSYTRSKLGPYPERVKFNSEEEFTDAKKRYESRYSEFCGAVERAYVDTSFTIRVPFLGFSFDVNDLGLLGGVGFLAILTCYRFFLSRELNNLRMSFEEARQLGMDHLGEFYKLLAMRQVFTVPVTKNIKRTWFLAVAPKTLSWLPLVIYLAVVVNDVRTAWIGSALALVTRDVRTSWIGSALKLGFRMNLLFGSELVAVISMAILCSHINIRLVRMDRLWSEYWNTLEEHERQSAVSQHGTPASAA